MTRSFRKWTAVFSGVQLCGLAAMWIWPHARAAGSVLWATAFINLFPGNILSTMLIERLFWKSSLSSIAMLAFELPLTVGINALLWIIIFGVIQKLIGWHVLRLGTRTAAK